MKRPALVLAIAAAAGLAAAVWGWRAAQPTVTPAAPAASATAASFPRCRLTVGASAAYAIESSVTAEEVKGSPPDRIRTVLSWRVVEPAPAGGWFVRAAFAGTERDQKLTRPDQRAADDLDLPFMLRVDESCKLAEKGFPAAWRAPTRRLVTSVLGPFELVVPADLGALRWSAEQVDALGTYRADYTARRLESGVFELAKVIVVYREDANTGPFTLKIQVVEGKAIGTLEPDGAWLREASGTQHVRLSAQGKQMAELEQRFHLTRKDESFREPSPDVTAASLDWKPLSFADGAAAAPEPPDPSLRAVSYDDAVTRFSAAYTKNPNGDAYAAARLLADWLRARPEQAAVVADAIKRRRMDAKLHPAAFLALELCGTDEARAVLGKLVSDGELSEMNRARAASALSDVPKPTRESAQALVQASRPSGPTVVAGTSVRALGHLASRADSLPPEVASDVHDTLKRDLDTAPGTARSVDVLDAIGNSNDTRFVPSLSQKLKDPSNTIREHAAHAMRGMPLADAEAPLLEALEKETDSGVRMAIVGSLEQMGAKDARALTIGAAELEKEGDGNVRGALIRWLGAAVKEPIAKQALVAQFKRETVAANLQLIGRFLPATDLAR